jgi:hypothetical protein
MSDETKKRLRPSDVRNLIKFNHRMSMFIWSPDRWSIMAFVHGYEYGTSNKCRFTELLGAHIAKQYGLKTDSGGWSHQIARFAEHRSLEWIDAYLLLSSELLNSALAPIPGVELRNSRAKPRKT